MQQEIKIESQLDLYNYCDQILHHLNKIYPKRESIETILRNTNSKEIQLIFDLLKTKGFIDGKKSGYYYDCLITAKGIQLIKENKTIQEHFHDINTKIIEKGKIESQKNEKLYYDTKLSKFKYYTFWILFVTSILGLVLSIYNLYYNNSKEQIRKEFEKKIEILYKQNGLK